MATIQTNGYGGELAVSRNSRRIKEYVPYVCVCMSSVHNDEYAYSSVWHGYGLYVRTGRPDLRGVEGNRKTPMIARGWPVFGILVHAREMKRQKDSSRTTSCMISKRHVYPGFFSDSRCNNPGLIRAEEIRPGPVRKQDPEFIRTFPQNGRRLPRARHGAGATRRSR